MLRTIVVKISNLVVKISNFVSRYLDPYRTEFGTCRCTCCRDRDYYHFRRILRSPEEYPEAEVEAAREGIARC